MLLPLLEYPSPTSLCIWLYHPRHAPPKSPAQNMDRPSHSSPTLTLLSKALHYPLDLGPWMGNESRGKGGRGAGGQGVFPRHTSQETSQQGKGTVNRVVHQRLEVITEFHSTSWENESALLPLLLIPWEEPYLSSCPLCSQPHHIPRLSPPLLQPRKIASSVHHPPTTVNRTRRKPRRQKQPPPNSVPPTPPPQIIYTLRGAGSGVCCLNKKKP